jgi:Fe-S-cluster containining protein
MAGIAFCAVDAERMAKHLNMKKNDWMREMTVASPMKCGDRWLKLEEGTLRCPYLSDKGCTVYEGRGQVCRNYPFYSAEQVESVRAGKPYQMYSQCIGMVKTTIKYINKSFEMDVPTAKAIAAGYLKKYTYLKSIENEGRGEAAKYAARDLGLNDVPDEETLKSMAAAYVVAYMALHTVEQRVEMIKDLNRMLEAFNE